MTDKIPDEIMQEAHHVRDELCIDCECKFDAGCGCLEAISRALMARDQRAAEIARHVPTPADVQDPMLRLGYISASQAIANAILSYDEARHD